jgi:hypothetical protein
LREGRVFDDEVFQAIVRGMKRQIENEVIHEIRSIRPDLLLLSPRERVEELEQSEGG